MAHDPDPRVRFQVALSLGETRDGSEDALYAIAVRDVEDQWTRLAVASSVGDNDNIVTKSGTYASGIIQDETPTTITLTSGEGGQEIVNRNDIASMTASGISLMPEGLEQGLDRNKLADLIAFLQQRPNTGQPSSPWWKLW